MILTDNLQALIGAEVLDLDGEKVGTVAQVYVDQVDNRPTWASVHTGLFGRSESFVPLEGATWEGGVLRVAHDKGRIKHAPRIDPDGDLSPADQPKLFEHYEMGGAVSGADDGERQTDDGHPSRGRSDDGTTLGDRDDRESATDASGTVASDTPGRLRRYIITEQVIEDGRVVEEVHREETEVDDGSGGRHAQ